MADYSFTSGSGAVSNGSGGLTVSETGQVVTITIEASGDYQIDVEGAQGGYAGLASPGHGAAGGLAASVGGDIYLTAGTQLEIVVGGEGASPFSGGGGGGGGSFVFDGNAVAANLLAAAGGGGGGALSFGGPSHITGGGGGGLDLGSNGYAGYGPLGGATAGGGFGGVGDSGGEGGQSAPLNGGGGGGGGGFTGGAGGSSVNVGGNGSMLGANAAHPFAGGGGVGSFTGGAGGFGGGGGGGWSGGGGGGGYGGGGGGGGGDESEAGAGGGGGSFLNTGTGFFSIPSSFIYSGDTTQGHAGNGEVTITAVVCFASGTKIRTLRGEIAVEALAVGDLAVTATGAARPIVWIGHRKLERPSPDQAPVRVMAGAFGEGSPSRDLLLSPGHAVCVDVMGEVFVPVSQLVNGTTIAPIDVREITYWHVELESHDVLLAEGLPCESYMDAGNRGFFGREYGRLTEIDPKPIAESLTRYARPFVDKGPIVAAIRHRLAARAAAAGTTAQDIRQAAA